jgi:hypothetical protein
MFGVADCIRDGIWLSVPQFAKRQRIGKSNQSRVCLCAGGLRKRAWIAQRLAADD